MHPSHRNAQARRLSRPIGSLCGCFHSSAETLKWIDMETKSHFSMLWAMWQVSKGLSRTQLLFPFLTLLLRQTPHVIHVIEPSPNESFGDVCREPGLLCSRFIPNSPELIEEHAGEDACKKVGFNCVFQQPSRNWQPPNPWGGFLSRTLTR